MCEEKSMIPAHLIVTHILPRVAREEGTTYLNLLSSSKEIYSNITPRDAAITLIAIRENNVQAAIWCAIDHNKIEIIRELIFSFGADIKEVEYLLLQSDKLILLQLQWLIISRIIKLLYLPKE